MLPLRISLRNGVTESAGTSVYGTASPSDRLLPGTSLWPVRVLLPDCKSILFREALFVTVAPSQGPTAAGEGSFARTRCAMPFPGTMCKGIQVRGRSQGRRERRNGRIPRHRARPAHNESLTLSTQPDVCRPAGSRSGNRERQEQRRGRAVEESLLKSLCLEAGSTIALWGGPGLYPRGARSPGSRV